uniref:NADH-ubiquinone oxidoreductase chain 2 n=1 Tax=Siphluriscus chinensis TaxID=981053 RepID=A0A067XFY8_9INSE|nr:NADH dehydrogenase subunit 2 [Siphluriscus chinensis]UZN92473.1 NADH dehydrogenase subunit 2 [Siphluriscus sp. l JZ-2022]
MLLNPTRLLFLSSLVLGTLLTISSNSWFGCWAGLEINLLSFIPLMSNSKDQFSSESALKYFLTQALASSILLFSVIVVALDSQLIFSFTYTSQSSIMILASALLLKVGAPPFHFWFPGVMEGLNWSNCLILMIWQKIGPLMLLSYLHLPSKFTLFIIMLSVMTGSLGGFNQTSLRKIMAYSSINHLGWMLGALCVGENFWVTYFMFYSMLSFIVIMLFMMSHISHINQVFSWPNQSPVFKVGLFSSLLSLGGLPPFIGFLPKWLIIQGMTESGHLFIVIFMVFMTLITLYIYLRMGYGAFMLVNSQMKWNFHFITPSYLGQFSLGASVFSFCGLSFTSLAWIMF